MTRRTNDDGSTVRTTVILARLADLHGEVDVGVRVLERLHAGHLRCRRGCRDCCVDGITVFELEAERIRRRHPFLLREEDPNPSGACAFLDPEGGCRIYDERPYVCRTQGLPLRWLERSDAGDTVEYRDICPLNDDPGAPLQALDPCACWTLGPTEARLATLQRELGGEPLRRIELRRLFDRD